MFSAISQVVVAFGLSIFAATADPAATNPSVPDGAIYFVQEDAGDLPGQERRVRRLTVIESDGKVTRRGGRGDLGDEFIHQIGYDWARDRILAITDSGHHLSIGVQDGVAEYLFWDTSVLLWSGIVGGRDGWIYYWSGAADDDGRRLTQTLVRRKPHDEREESGHEPLRQMPVEASCVNLTWVDNFQGRMTGVISWCDGKPYFFDPVSFDFFPIDMPAAPTYLNSQTLRTHFTWHDRTTDTILAIVEGDTAVDASILSLTPRSKRWEKTANFKPNKEIPGYYVNGLSVFVPGPVNRCPCE